MRFLPLFLIWMLWRTAFVASLGWAEAQQGLAASLASIPGHHAGSYELNASSGYEPVPEEDRHQEVWVFDVPASEVHYRQSEFLASSDRFEGPTIPIYVLPRKTPALAKALANAGYAKRSGTHFYAAKETSHNTWLVWDAEHRRVLHKLKFQNSHQTKNSWSTTIAVNDMIETLLSETERSSEIGYYPERTGLSFSFESAGKKYVQSYTLREPEVHYMDAKEPDLKLVLDIPFFALSALLNKRDQGHYFAPAIHDLITSFMGSLAVLNFADGVYPMSHNQNFHVLIGERATSTRDKPQYALMGVSFQDTFDTAFDPVQRIYLDKNPHFEKFVEWMSVMNLHHSYKDDLHVHYIFHQAFTDQIINNFAEVFNRVNIKGGLEAFDFSMSYYDTEQAILEAFKVAKYDSKGFGYGYHRDDVLHSLAKTPQFDTFQWEQFKNHEALLKKMAREALRESEAHQPKIFFYNSYFKKLSRAYLLKHSHLVYRNGYIQAHLFEPNLVAAYVFPVSEKQKAELDLIFRSDRKSVLTISTKSTKSLKSPTYSGEKDVITRALRLANLSTDFEMLSNMAITFYDRKKGFRGELRKAVTERLKLLVSRESAKSSPKLLFSYFAKFLEFYEMSPELWQVGKELLIMRPEVLHPQAIMNLLLHIENKNIAYREILKRPDGRAIMKRIYKHFQNSYGRGSETEMIDPKKMYVAEWRMQKVFLDAIIKRRSKELLKAYLLPVMDLAYFQTINGVKNTTQKHFLRLLKVIKMHVEQRHPRDRRWVLELIKEHEPFETRLKSCWTLVNAAAASRP